MILTTPLRRLWLAVVLLGGSAVAQAPHSMKSPVNVEGPSRSPLIRAIMEQDTAHARKILDSGEPNPNARDQFQETALDAAIRLGLSDIVEELVSQGANPNLTGGRNQSPLMQAASQCNVRVARFLIEHGATLKAVDLDGQTALAYASYICADGEVVAFLVQSGAPINVRDKLGYTPLIDAAWNGSEEIARILVDASADVTIKDNDGETAESIACGRTVGRKEGHDRICSLLRAVNADEARD